MERAPSPCNLCGATAYGPYRQRSLPHVVRCGGCGLVRVEEFPDSGRLAEIYSAEYFRNDTSNVLGYADYESDRPFILRTAHRRLRKLEQLAPGRGRILDVGCAFGYFLEAARRRGWDVEGIDLSEHAVAYARQHLGDAAVHTGQLEQAGLPLGSFDVITLWDVVEHFPDPVEKLAYCRELLKPGGLLVLSTPDIGSPVARVTGPRWMGFKLADEHLYYFSRRTMGAMLERAGFAVVRTFPVGKDVSLGLFGARLRLYVPPLAAVVDALVRLTGRGRASVYVNPRDIMCVVARKPAAG